VKRYPTFLRAWANLGVIYYTTGRYPQAVTCFAKCVSLGDRDPTTFGLLAYSLEQQKKVVQAEMAYMQALAGDPANADWLEASSASMSRASNMAGPEWLVKDLIKQRPKETRFWLVYANILVAQSRKLEAIALLEVSMGTGVAGPNELNLLADLYARTPTRARGHRRLPARHGRHALKWARRSCSPLPTCFIYSGSLPQAQKVLDSLAAAKLTPAGRTAALLSRSDLLVAQNKWTEARATLEDVLKAEPLSGRALLQSRQGLHGGSQPAPCPACL